MKCNRYREGMIELGLSVRVHDRSSLFCGLFWQPGLVNEEVVVLNDYEFLTPQMIYQKDTMYEQCWTKGSVVIPLPHSPQALTNTCS